jgi:hypothetical protein
MPNWCSNCLQLDPVPGCSDEQVSKFLQRAQENPKDLMGAFRPIPEALINMHHGGCTLKVLEEDGTIRKESMTNWRDEHQRKGEDYDLTEEAFLSFTAELEELEAAYGTMSWYDWAVSHWGTKWSADIRKVENNRIWFDTAWSPPIAWLEFVSTKYHEVEFTLAFAEGGACYWGTACAVNGVVEETNGDDFWSDRPEEVPEEVWRELDEVDRVSTLVRRHLQQYGLHTGG